jgi:hypothetical protein
MNSPLAFFKKDGQRGRSEKKNAAGKNRRQVRQGGMKLDRRNDPGRKAGKAAFPIAKIPRRCEQNVNDAADRVATCSGVETQPTPAIDV